jgi:hypothetical protein
VSIYDGFTDTVAWEASTGDDAQISGRRAFAPAIQIPAQVASKTVRLDGDRVADRVVKTYPQHDVAVGDRLDGAEILQVVRATAGGVVRFWVCYGKL